MNYLGRVQYRPTPPPDPDAITYYQSSLGTGPVPPLNFWTSVAVAIGGILAIQKIIVYGNEHLRECAQTQVWNEEEIFYKDVPLLCLLLRKMAYGLVPVRQTRAWYLAGDEQGYQFLVGYDSITSDSSELAPVRLQTIRERFADFNVQPQPHLDSTLVYWTTEALDQLLSVLRGIRSRMPIGFPEAFYFRSELFEVVALSR